MANMYSLYWITTVILASGTLVLSAFCPEGWTSDPLDAQQSTCLHYIPTEATFNDAKKSCRHLNAELAIPRGYIDTASIANHIQTEVAVGEKKNVWLDMKEQENGEWTTSNGSTILSPIDWHLGYPEGDGQCGVFMYENAKMKNRDCSLRSAFICRGNMASIQPLRTCQTPQLPDDTMTHPLVGRLLKTGTYAYLTCEPDYHLSTEGHRKLYCGKNGRWNKDVSELAACKIAVCKSLPVADDVITIYDEGDDVGAVKALQCPEKSRWNVDFLTDNTNLELECNEEGKWEETTTGEIIIAVGSCDLTPIGDGTNSAQTILWNMRLPIYFCFVTILSFVSH